MNARLHVSGGALGGGRMVEDASSVAGVLWGLSFCNHVYIHISSLWKVNLEDFPVFEIFRLDRHHVSVICCTREVAICIH